MVPATPLRKGEGKFITLALWRLLSLSLCCVQYELSYMYQIQKINVMLNLSNATVIIEIQLD